MKLNEKRRLTALITSLLIVGMTACSPQPSATTLTEEPEIKPSETVAVESLQTNLLTYDETANGIPVTARYPDMMEVSDSGSSEGVGVFFTFKPQGNALDEAEVHVFLPANTATAADQMQFVTGSNGLMGNNGWTVNSIQSDGSAEFPYPWVTTVINFSTDKEQSGYILLGQIQGQVLGQIQKQVLGQIQGQMLGQIQGQAVQVTLLYPSEMADAYWPSAKTVLESMAFDTNLLPITRSSEQESL